MKKPLKKIVSQLHLWLGILSGLVVFIVAATGVILVFEEELEPLLDAGFYKVAVPADPRRLPLDQLISNATARYPGYPLGRVVIEPSKERTVIVEMVKNRKKKEFLAVAVNPYTGQITGAHDGHSTFFAVVLRLHRYLCLEETGKAITGVSCVIFLILIVTGLVLWWPKKRNRSQRFRVKWNASFKRLNWDLHAVVGFYLMPVILVIGLTGLVWSYKWVNDMLFIAFDGKPQQKKEAPQNRPSEGPSEGKFERMLTQTNKLLPNDGKLLLIFPEKDSLSITASKRDDQAKISNIVNFLFFDHHTGELIAKRMYDNETTGMKVRRLIFPIHTGSLLGLPTQIIALLASLLAASLPVTGFLIWLGKKRKSKKKERRRAKLKQQSVVSQA